MDQFEAEVGGLLPGTDYQIRDDGHPGHSEIAFPFSHPCEVVCTNIFPGKKSRKFIFYLFTSFLLKSLSLFDKKMFVL